MWIIREDSSEKNMKIDLYIGGHAQGKEKLVREKYGSSACVINELHMWIRERLEKIYKDGADTAALTEAIMKELDVYLTEQVEKSEKQSTVSDETEKDIHVTGIKKDCESVRTVVIISDEIGCGIVPIGSFDRCWREVTGRVLTRLAARAEGVYRVTCGLERKIK